MKVREAVEKLKEYQRVNFKDSSIRNYNITLKTFDETFGGKDVTDVTSENVSSFLVGSTANLAQNTRHLRFTQVKAFFNFCINIMEIKFINPCATRLMNKTFKGVKNRKRPTISKDVIDEMIYQAIKSRDRLLIEIQARGGLRIGEVLKLKCKDIEGRKITLQSPKSGNQQEQAFLPTTVSEKIKSFIAEANLEANDMLFGLSYSAARNIVVKSGKRIGVSIRPHDLRRHAATYASRNGVPLEVVSKIILRHQNLSTTQIYLGKISDYEALHWIDSLYDK